MVGHLTRRPVLLLLAALGSLLLAAPALAIVGGQPDGSRHPYVGAFYQAGRFACSGELVSPTKVVSAAHCAELGFDQSTAPVTFTLDPQPGVSSVYYPVTSWVKMPGFSGNTDPTVLAWPNYHNDLLVATLGKTVKNVTPVKLPSANYVDTLNLRTQVFTLVGYGTTDLSRDYQTSGYGIRMYVDVSAKKGQNISLSGEYILVSGMANTGSGCFGDSGGANLVGDTLVATITGGNGYCSDWTYTTRVDRPEALQFILSQL